MTPGGYERLLERARAFFFGGAGNECLLPNPIYNQQPQPIFKLSLKLCSFAGQGKTNNLDPFSGAH